MPLSYNCKHKHNIFISEQPKKDIEFDPWPKLKLILLSYPKVNIFETICLIVTLFKHLSINE